MQQDFPPEEAHAHWLSQQVAAPPPIKAVEPIIEECPKCQSTAPPKVRGRQRRCSKCGALLKPLPGTAKAGK